VDYPILAPEGEYVGVFDSDNERYGGYGNIDEDVKHLTEHDGLYAAHHLGWLKLYLPARSAQVLRLKPARVRKPRTQATAPKAPAKKKKS